jgi:hypothetical protein
MVRTLLAGAILAGLVGCASGGGPGSAQAGGEPFRCPKPGTIIETSVGGRFEFTNSDGFYCNFRIGRGSGSRYAMLLAGDSTWIKMGGANLRKLWPLRPGNSEWFVASGTTSTGYPTSWYETYTVEGRERITVPAGTFDTYRMTWTEQGREESFYKAVMTYWFAPAVGYFVKFQGPEIPQEGLEGWVATRVVIPR